MWRQSLPPGWMRSSSNVIKAAVGFSELPVFERDPQDVLTRGAHIRPFASPSNMLAISSWRLAHAVKKAECSGLPSPAFLRWTSLGFLLEQSQLLHWNGHNLRLFDGMANFYDDFSRTSLAGRIAQGVTVLFMEDRGFPFFERFGTFMRRHGGQSILGRVAAKKGSEGSRSRAPDFVHESATQERALVESKGGFVSPRAQPDIKGALRSALGQLSVWGDYLVPRIPKAYAIATYLREVSDTSTEPSLIAFVDPDSDEQRDGLYYPRTAIRMGNYASWLAAMGLVEASMKLWSGSESSPEAIHAPVVTIQGNQVAIAPLGEPRHPWSWFSIYETERFIQPGVLPFMGIRLDTLRTLGETMRTDSREPLERLEQFESRTLLEEVEGGSIVGSCFADGSYVGQISLKEGMSFDNAVVLEEVLL